MPLKFETKAERNMFGKANGQFACTLPGTGWRNAGATKAEAEAELLKRLEQAYEYTHARHYLRAHDSTWVLSYQDGWGYDIVHDAEPYRAGSCMLTGCKSYSQAKLAMKTHFDQYQADYQTAKLAITPQ